MSRFKDSLCPVCRLGFTDNDDVVVCPECGTPHHRACYILTNRCGVEAYHAEGFSWNGRLPDETAAESVRDRFDPHHAEYPENISSDFSHAEELNIPEMKGFEEIPNPYFELYRQIRSVTDDEVRGKDGVSGKELCHFAGKSIMHYSQAFNAFRSGIIRNGVKQPVKIFMNACAGLFMPIHQFYRRMDVLGVALLLLSAMISLPEILLYYDAEYSSIEFSAATTQLLDTLSMVASIVNIAAMMLMCIFGDYIYYRFCVRRIKKIRSRFDDGRAEGYYMALAESGSPSKLRIVIGLLAYLIVTQLVAKLPGQLLM